MPIKDSIGRGKALIWSDAIDGNTRAQVARTAQLGFIEGHVAVMPDAHYGIGATVGTVIPTRGAIVPAAVGVDIGCGMMAVRTSLSESDLPDSLSPARSAIEKAVPVGQGRHSDEKVFRSAPGAGGIEWRAAEFEGTLPAHWRAQMGTLGGGNHFIEVCVDDEGRIWAMLHSGSRGAGNKLGTRFIAEARREMERYSVHLADADLAYLREGTPSFLEYCRAVGWAQDFAKANRRCMMDLVLQALRKELPAFKTDAEAVECHHNYVEPQDAAGNPLPNEAPWSQAHSLLTRKGAISARRGQLGIVPGSMGTKSYIVEGLGNPKSHFSSSHGAGRRMSRGAARKAFGAADVEQQTKGVECRKDLDIRDELPEAYKDLDEVMAFQSDLTKPIRTLRALICVKG